MTEVFSDNTHLSRFELAVDDKLAFARYRREPARMAILYVEAEPALRGTGAAGRLMKEIVGVAQSESRKIVPICGYAVAWLRRNRPDIVA
jgi:predicted GNAT family acetyltransferase